MTAGLVSRRVIVDRLGSNHRRTARRAITQADQELTAVMGQML